MLMRVLCCVLSVLCLSVNAAEIYKTRDKDGNLVYSDQPPPGDSEIVILPPINTVPSNPTAPVYDARKAAAAETGGYQLSIISPRENVTIPPGQRDLAIAINLSKPLEPNHLLMYFINGELLEETRSTSIVVQEVYRGSHILMVEVVDVNGKSLGRSPEVVVNVIRPTINSPARASPSPRPR